MDRLSKSTREPRWRSRGRALIEQRLLGQGAESRVSQTVLQQDLQRFVGRFMERIIEAAEPLSLDANSEFHERAMRRVLLLSSNALDIASGPVPELNMLDMIVMVELSRDAFEQHWLPEVFGEAGRDLLTVLSESAQEIWSLGTKVLNEELAARLRETLHAWQLDHPQQLRVEGVRFSAFSSVAASARESRLASGILDNVRAATRTADQAVLLGERFMFLASRIPFLVRMHARIGVLELLSDGVAKLGNLESLVNQAQELRPMLGEVDRLVPKLTNLAERATETSGAAQSLSESALPLLTSIQQLLKGAPDDRVQKILAGSDSLVGKTRSLLTQVSGLTTDDPAQALEHAAARMESLLRRMLWQVAAVGAGLIAIFWAGYYLAH